MEVTNCDLQYLLPKGVSQLSAVLHSDVAVDASVRIMDAFVAMRRFITANAGLFQRVGALEQKQIMYLLVHFCAL